MSKAKKDPKPKAPTLATVIDVVDTNAQALATLAANTAEFADACEERIEDLDGELHSLSVTVARGEADRERIEARLNALLRLVLETAAPQPSLWQRIKSRVQSYSVWSRDEA